MRRCYRLLGTGFNFASQGLAGAVETPKGSPNDPYSSTPASSSSDSAACPFSAPKHDVSSDNAAKPSASSALGTRPVASSQVSSPAGWMAGAAWAALGEEFKTINEEKYLKPMPQGFLTERAVTEVQPAEELMKDHIAHISETYKEVDVRNPNTVALYDGHKPSWLTMGDKVRAVSEFISGHMAHQVSLPAWQELFDLKHVEMDVMYWLWVLHLHIIARRATSVPINTWARRREVLEELLLTMFASWTHTSEEIMGRPPLTKIRDYIKDMYYVTAVNIEEAMMYDGPGSDLMLMGMLVKFCPLPRPEDVPMYTYYTLVHYIRFHAALFDRISDEEFAKGNFNFLPPDDRSIFSAYTDVELDKVIRSWNADGEEIDPEQEVAPSEKAREERFAREEAKAAAGETAQ